MIRALNTAGLSDLEKRVVKATYDDDEPPKQKHVEALILLSADHELVPFLDRRMVSPLWNVCLKCLSLVHKLSLEADERFLTELQSAPTLLTVPQQFDTSADPTATAHTRFIHAYAEYLQAKVRSYELLHVSCERQQPADSKRWVMKLKVTSLVKGLPLLQRQFDALLLVQPANSEDLNHPIPIACMTLTIKDAFRLYSVLTVMMLAVLERYESMTLPQTERMLRATHNFLSQNTKFRKWADKLCKNGFVDRKLLPKFDAIPVTFLQLLEEHIVELGGVVREPTPTPSAKQRSPRGVVENSSGQVRSVRPQRRGATASRRSGAPVGQSEAEEAAAAEEDEEAMDQRVEQRPASGTIERKRSSQVRGSVGLRTPYDDAEYGSEQQDDGVEESYEAAHVQQQRTRQPQQSGGGVGSSGIAVRRAQQQLQQQQQQNKTARRSMVSRHTAREDDEEQQQAQQLDDEVDDDGELELKRPQQQPTRTQRPAVSARTIPPQGRPSAVQPPRRTAAPSQPQPQLYEDEQEFTEADGYTYDEQRQQLPVSQRDDPGLSSLPQRTARPAGSVRLAQPQSQRSTQQRHGLTTGTGHRSSRPLAGPRPPLDAYYDGQPQFEAGNDVGEDYSDATPAAVDDPLALYMQSTPSLFTSPSPNTLTATARQQQQQQPAPSAFSSLSASSSRLSNPSTTTASRSAAKARVAAALSSELNLFDNFDPLTLHPAEQRALDRQQADMQAAFFTNPPLMSSSSLQPPPPAYEVEEYDTSDEGVEQPSADEQRPQQQTEAGTDLFSDLTARLHLNNSDRPPTLPVAVVSRPSARPPAAKSASARLVAASAVQRPAASIRAAPQPSQARPRQRQAAPTAVYDDANDEDEDGSEPNFL